MTIVLDTNVVSEVMRPHPESAVIEWLNSTDGKSLYVSTITIAEIEYGLHAMPEGQRREDLRARFETFIHTAFAQRVLGFDEPSARHYGRIMAARRQEGRPLSAPDGHRRPQRAGAGLDINSDSGAARSRARRPRLCTPSGTPHRSGETSSRQGRA
ncbi:type II toxin-antitoxin system VapC family toxin [Halorhodospira halophila]|uniref:Nucleic acid-binding protein contains PIN domain-like protein n=1 Tax=Halorhodospira halophila (strain DSM 244 / SL1) TaxID=349124 RepID=A1WV56_HALHL|nr:nucleic acid-binding protein contains PIN domain-like protein [Halorhodospira halophila SL1]MBK1728814.1 PIN domain-containing protein [Halorhodospira halophila]